MMREPQHESAAERIVKLAKGSLDRCKRGSYTLGKTASKPPQCGGRRTVKLAFSCNQILRLGEDLCICMISDKDVMVVQ